MTLRPQVISAHMKNLTLVQHPKTWLLSLTNRLLHLSSTYNGVCRVRRCFEGDSEVNTIADKTMAATEGEIAVFSDLL